MVYLLYGPDTFRAGLFLKDRIPSGAEVVTLEGEGLSPETLRQALATRPMFGEARWVIVRGYPSKAAMAVLPALIHSASDEVGLVFLIGAELRDGDPLLRLARERGQVHRYPSLGKGEVLRWIRERAERKGLKFEDGALDPLWQVFGSDLLAIETELDRLAVYSAGEMLSQQTVRDLLGGWAEEKLWVLFAALRNRNQAQALEVVHRLMAQGMDPSQVLAGLVNYLRRVLYAASSRERGDKLVRELMALEVAGTSARQFDEWQVRGIIEHASQVGEERLRRQYAQLAAADELIKSTSVPAEVVLDLLVRHLAGGPDARLEEVLEAARQG